MNWLSNNLLELLLSGGIVALLVCIFHPAWKRWRWKKTLERHDWFMCTNCEFPLDKIRHKTDVDGFIRCPECGSQLNTNAIRQIWTERVNPIQPPEQN